MNGLGNVDLLAKGLKDTWRDLGVREGRGAHVPAPPEAFLKRTGLDTSIGGGHRDPGRRGCICDFCLGGWDSAASVLPLPLNPTAAVSVQVRQTMTREQSLTSFP